MHPRVSVNPASFPAETGLDDLIDLYVGSGAHSVGYRRSIVADEGSESALARIEAAPIRPAYLVQREFFRLAEPDAWKEDRTLVRETVDWVDRALRETIRTAGPTIALVQVCDYSPGDRTMDRGVPGTGVIPLERLFSWVLETGYEGFFDLELWGDAGMDDVEAVKRGAD